MVSGNDEYPLVLHAPDGQLLLSGNASRDPMPTTALLTPDAAIVPNAIRAWITPAGYTVRGITVLGYAQGPARFTFNQAANCRVTSRATDHGHGGFSLIILLQ